MNTLLTLSKFIPRQQRLLSRFQYARITNKSDQINFATLQEIKNKSKFGIGELQTLHSQFKRRAGLDLSLGKEEFREMMKLLGVNDEPLIDRSFSVFDTDKSGSIDFREFASGMSIIMRGSVAEKYDYAFRVWDVNGDGLLDKEEFRKFLKGTQNKQTMDDYLFERIWAELDIDGNGSITWEACKKGIAKHQLGSKPSFFQDTLDSEAISQEEKEILSLLAERMHLTKGELVQHQDQIERYFYILIEGELELSRSGVKIATLDKMGDVFGGESLVDMPSTKRVTCMSNSVQLLRINVDDIVPLIYHSHIGAVNLVQRVSSRLIERYQSISTLSMSHDVLSQDKTWIETCHRGLQRISLYYHSLGKNGKLEIKPTKSVGSAEDLSVAYSPGVAEPCLAIKDDPEKAYEYTTKGHLVGVISNGTAVLGLGNIGALASKPVMEGKAVLFKKFGGLDSFDIEVDESDPDKFIHIVASLEPTFGGINIEDVKAPECFYIEREVQKRCKIPIMHDDQHGTAIIAGAGLLNALEIIKKDISQIKVVVSGCGAAGFTCARYFTSLGVRPENLVALDIKGVVYKGRDDLVADPKLYLNEVAVDTDKRTLADVIEGADVFLGVSVGGLLKPEMLMKMNKDPIVFALANPTPEISYNIAKKTRPDVIIATGRSDYPNQINNVCAFPYIFRGSMDVQAKAITEDIKQAATKAIAAIAKSDTEKFGRDYIIPKPFDPRLKIEVSAAVAHAAMSTGIARKVLDLDQYKETLRGEII